MSALQESTMSSVVVVKRRPSDDCICHSERISSFN